MAPLSPDGGTTTSTNSTSPALSSTLSESSSLLDVSILQQQQQQQAQNSNISSQPQQIQVVRTNYQIGQQSPGQQLKLPENILETNAYANKSEPLLPNNLLIMANEHKEFSCSVGDENIVKSSSNNNLTKINQVPESDEKISKQKENEENVPSLSNDERDISQGKNHNLSVASNIANAFINISSLSAGSNGLNGNAQTKSLNVVVTQQPISQHFMKTLSFTTSRGGIFVPNVLTANVTPQFTVHQYGLHGNPNGPAPNVTVNPSGNFNTNSNVVRPGAPNHFRLLFQQSPNINLNVVSSQPSSNPSPILEASLQTLNKVACVQSSSKVFPLKTVQNSIKSQKNALPIVLHQQKSVEDTTHEPSQVQDPLSVNNDQHIRVLTPSEIMKTLPSLNSQDNVCFNSSVTSGNEVSLNDSKAQNFFTQNSEASGSVTISFKNTTSSSSLNVTSECNTLSSNFVTTKATMSSNNAQIQMVSGYKTYKYF